MPSALPGGISAKDGCAAVGPKVEANELSRVLIRPDEQRLDPMMRAVMLFFGVDSLAELAVKLAGVE